MVKIYIDNKTESIKHKTWNWLKSSYKIKSLVIYKLVKIHSIKELVKM